MFVFKGQPSKKQKKKTEQNLASLMFNIQKKVARRKKGKRKEKRKDFK